MVERWTVDREVLGSNLAWALARYFVMLVAFVDRDVTNAGPVRIVLKHF